MDSWPAVDEGPSAIRGQIHPLAQPADDYYYGFDGRYVFGLWLVVFRVILRPLGLIAES